MLNGAPGGKGGGGDFVGHSGPGGGGNLADQIVSSALRYRAQAPVVDTLLKEIGLKSPNSDGVSNLLNEQLSAGSTQETEVPALPRRKKKERGPTISRGSCRCLQDPRTRRVVPVRFPAVRNLSGTS